MSGEEETNKRKHQDLNELNELESLSPQHSLASFPPDDEPSHSLDDGLLNVNEQSTDIIVIEDEEEKKDKEYFRMLKNMIIKSSQSKAKKLKEDNIDIKFSTCSGKYRPFIATVEPSVHEDIPTFVCLLCASISIVANKTEEHRLKLFKGKNITQNFRSHAKQTHPEVLEKDENKVKHLIQLLMNMFGNKVGQESLVKLTDSEIKKVVEGTSYFQSVSVEIARVREALWLMTSTLPSTVVENEEYRSFLRSLNKEITFKSRQTESEMELAIFGFCVKEIKERIKKSYRYFMDEFICLECDVWTSQSNLSVLGVGITFYDVIEKKAVTIVLGAVPLVKGKTAAELIVLIRKILALFDIKSEYIHSAVGDGEKAVQNCLTTLVGPLHVNVCLAHELQTIVRHSTGCASKIYKRDPFKEGFEFFDKMKKVVKMFTMSPKKERRLRAIQTSKNEKVLVGLLKFSGTR